jgi:hypothetical protein
VHAIERELYGEIVQIKKERLVQVTRCTASQTIKSAYCEIQSRLGMERETGDQGRAAITPKGESNPYARVRGLQGAGEGKLKVGELEHPVAKNTTRSHMEGSEDYSETCGLQARILNRKTTQVLMEVLIEREWIWWNEDAGKVTTA